MPRLSWTVLRNSTLGLAAQFAIKVLSFAFSVLVVRRLGAEAFGQYAAISAFGAIFVFVADLGLSPYAVRQLARWRDAADGPAQAAALLADLLRLRLLLALLAGALQIGAAWLTGRPLFMLGAIALNAVTLLLYGLQGTTEAVLAGFERLDLTAGFKVLHQLTFVLLGALALLAGGSYWGLILANMLGVALMAYAGWRGVRALRLRALGGRPRRWPGLLRASLPFGIIGFALGLSYRFDTVLLNIFRSDVETGYYNAAYNLVFSTVVISNVVNTALYPSLAREAARSTHGLPRVYERVLRYLLAVSLPIAVGVWAVAGQLVPALFGAEYVPATQALRIVIWVVPLMFTSEFLGYVVVISDREGRVARAVLVSTALNVLVNLALVPRFGFTAAAVMTVITEAVLVSQHAWTLRATLRHMSWGRTLLRPLAASLLMGLVVVLPGGRLPLPASVALGVVTYAVLLVGLGVLGRDEARLVRSAFARRAASPVPGGSD
jgi:O-antigen/teichoic acid export membrane protein